MGLQVWSDNETTQDLLGFRVHADLIRTVVTSPDVLPIVLGLFGDWGGGKSSVMQMLRQELDQPAFEDTACLYFNGWMFEGYEDAKTALLSSILIQLGEHKRFGPKVRGKVVGLLKRVKWMEGAKLAVRYVGVPLGASLLTGGIAAIPAATAAVAAGVVSSAAGSSDSKHEGESVNWSALIEKAPEQQDLLEVRRFREEFAEMLTETDLSSLVILIDDLDRCLPERIIETLEAIKLFVAVPKTAFVIGADPRIVRHAIAVRYAKDHIPGDSVAERGEQYDLVTDYLEKLIQVPYHLPRLSPSEIETYINLLACKQALPPSQCDTVLRQWLDYRKNNIFKAYRLADICAALGASYPAPQVLIDQLAWSNSIADVVTDGLKGNPRQVKRMLNAMALRKQLAVVADIRIRDEVLAKLMVLEYSNPTLFQELSQWQAASSGVAEKLKVLEEAAIKSDKHSELPAEVSQGWAKPTAQHWLQMQPGLADLDLRDYFWLARDRTSSTLSGVTMVSPLVRRLFDSILSDNRGEQHLAARDAATLGSGERSELLEMLMRQIQRHPDQSNAMDALISIGKAGAEEAYGCLLTSLKTCPPEQLDPGVIFRVKSLRLSGKAESDAKSLIADWAKDTRTRIGRAAAKESK